MSWDMDGGAPDHLLPLGDGTKDGQLQVHIVTPSRGRWSLNVLTAPRTAAVLIPGLH